MGRRPRTPPPLSSDERLDLARQAAGRLDLAGAALEEIVATVFGQSPHLAMLVLERRGARDLAAALRVHRAALRRALDG